MYYCPSSGVSGLADAELYVNDDPGFNGLGRLGLTPAQICNKQAGMQWHKGRCITKVGGDKEAKDRRNAIEKALKTIDKYIADIRKHDTGNTRGDLVSYLSNARLCLIGQLGANPIGSLSNCPLYQPPVTEAYLAQTIKDLKNKKSGGGSSGGGGAGKTAEQKCADKGVKWAWVDGNCIKVKTPTPKEECIASGKQWKGGKCKDPVVTTDPGSGGGGSTQRNPCQFVTDEGDVIQGTIDASGNCKAGGSGGGGGGGGGGTFGDETAPYTIQTYDPTKCVSAKQKFNNALSKGRLSSRNWDRFVRVRPTLMQKVNSLCPPPPADVTPPDVANKPCTVTVGGVQRTGTTDAGGGCVIEGDDQVPPGGGYDYTPPTGGGNYVPPGSGYGYGYQNQFPQYTPPYVPGGGYETELYESDIGGESLVTPLAPGAVPTAATGMVATDPITAFFNFLTNLLGGGAQAAPAPAAAPVSDDPFADIPTELDFSDPEGSRRGGDGYGGYGDQLATEDDVNAAFGLKQVQGRVVEAV